MISPSAAAPDARGRALTEAGRYLDRAVERLEFLVAIGLGATLLTLVIDAVQNTGLTNDNAQVYGLSGSLLFGGVIVGVATAGIVLLVLAGLYLAISGLIAWRRGVWSLRRARTVPGLPASTEIEASVQDDRRTWMALALVFLLAIVAGIIVGISDAALVLGGLPAIPGAIANLVVGLVAGGAVVLVYWYGTRHLIEALRAIAPQFVSDDLLRGQNLVLAGAILGWVGAVSAVVWPFQIVSAAGILLVLFGIERFHVAYRAAVTVSPRGPVGGSAPSTV